MRDRLKPIFAYFPALGIFFSGLLIFGWWTLMYGLSLSFLLDVLEAEGWVLNFFESDSTPVLGQALSFSLFVFILIIYFLGPSYLMSCIAKLPSTVSICIGLCFVFSLPLAFFLSVGRGLGLQDSVLLYVSQYDLSPPMEHTLKLGFTALLLCGCYSLAILGLLGFSNWKRLVKWFLLPALVFIVCGVLGRYFDLAWLRRISGGLFFGYALLFPFLLMSPRGLNPSRKFPSFSYPQVALTSAMLLILIAMSTWWVQNNAVFERFYQQGLSAKENGAYEEAIDYFEQALQVDKTNYRALINLGECYWEVRRNAEAYFIYKKALPYAPTEKKREIETWLKNVEHIIKEKPFPRFTLYRYAFLCGNNWGMG